VCLIPERTSSSGGGAIPHLTFFGQIRRPLSNADATTSPARPALFRLIRNGSTKERPPESSSCPKLGKDTSNGRLGPPEQLREGVRAFFQGAKETWERFTEEFHAGGIIDKMTKAQKEEVWICATNDHNEGAFGSLRQSMHRAPHKSLHRRSPEIGYRKNETSGYMTTLSSSQLGFLRKEGRKITTSGLERTRMMSYVSHREKKASRKTEDRRIRAEKQAGKDAELQALQPCLDVEMLRKGRGMAGGILKNSDIILEINWHRQFEGEVEKIPQKSQITKMKRDDKLIQLIIAVERYNRESLNTSISCNPTLGTTITRTGKRTRTLRRLIWMMGSHLCALYYLYKYI